MASTRRTYVLDTSVLLADPGAMFRFAEHEVVLPLIVISELEAKRHHTDLGWAARRAIRHLEDLRRRGDGRLTEPVPVNDHGGTLRVELNHVSPSNLPEAFVDASNDHRILQVARALSLEGARVTLVTKDLPLRLKAAAVDLDADDYRNDLAQDGAWSGVVVVDDVPADVIDRLHRRDPADTVHVTDVDTDDDPPVNAAMILRNGSQSAVVRVEESKALRLVPSTVEAFGLRPRSTEQRIALDALLDPDVGIVSIGGAAGCGKTVLALAAALELVVERRQFDRVIVFRPLFAVGGQDLGFLPGDQAEKMAPWAAGVIDALAGFCSRRVIDELLVEGHLEVLPLTHIRGRTFANSIVVVEEAQNLERHVLLSAMSRVGAHGRIFLTHDVTQRDNLRVGRDDGVAALVEHLRGHPLFAHTTLTKSERGPIAALAGRILEQY